MAKMAILTILRQRRRFRVNEFKRRVAVDKIHKNTEQLRFFTARVLKVIFNMEGKITER